jgi:hypothetical protein
MKTVWEELERLGIQPGGVDDSVVQPPHPKAMKSRGGGTVAPNESAGEEPMRPRANLDVSAIPSPSDDAIGGDGAFAVEELTGSESDTRHAETARPMIDASAPSHFTTTAAVPDLPLGASRYVAFEGHAGRDPRNTTAAVVAQGLCQVIKTEGPVLAKRAYDLYLRGCNIRRMGPELKRLMNRALNQAVRDGRVVIEDETGRGGLLYSIVRSPSDPAVRLRDRGPRCFDEIPSSELQLLARRIMLQRCLEAGSAEHFRAVLEFLELKRLTVQVEARLRDILGRRYAYVDDMVNG